MTNVISALAARNKFGQILRQVEKEQRSFLVQKRGSPKAVILSVQDYIKFKSAPEPKWLTEIGEASKRRGTDKLTMKQINKIIAQVRRGKLTKK